MHNTNRDPLATDLDGLRLIALGRIPRCSDCPRYRALVRAHDRGGCSAVSLPGVPQGCTYPVCAPLARRYKRVALGELQLAATGS